MKTDALEVTEPRQWLAAQGYEPAKLAILRDFFFSGMRGQKPTDAHMMLYLVYCQNHGLDPFSKQAHLIMTKNGPEICLGIDSMRKFAAQTGEYGGQDEPFFELDGKGTIVACKMTVYRIVQGHRAAFPAVAWMAESRGNSPIWSQRPRGMLEKCAEAKALRKAFPDRCGAFYAPEELDGQHDTGAPRAKAAATAADLNARLAAKAPLQKPQTIDAEVVPDEPKAAPEPADSLTRMLNAFEDIGVSEAALLDYIQKPSAQALTPADLQALRLWYNELTREDRE